MNSEITPSAGDILAGKYQLTRELGRGGMGVVYEATHLGLGQRVAVKVLLPWVAEQPELASRFEREVRASARLRGKHLVRVVDADMSRGLLPFFAMEYLEGHCLRKELSRRGRLPVEEAVRYVAEACEGMSEAHACGIVHRDLKPSNLFLNREGGRFVVKVLDFGVAKALDEVGAYAKTKTNMHLGTYRYMSPEQARSAGAVDARTDIWSLGVVLYELLAGFAPFKGPGVLGTLTAVASQPPPPLLEWRPDVPVDLAAVVERALCKDVRGRYQTMRELADALAPFGPAPSPPSPFDSARQGRPSYPKAPPVEALRGGEIMQAPERQGAQRAKGPPARGAPFGSSAGLTSLFLHAAVCACTCLSGALLVSRPGPSPSAETTTKGPRGEAPSAPNAEGRAPKHLAPPSPSGSNLAAPGASGEAPPGPPEGSHRPARKLASPKGSWLLLESSFRQAAPADLLPSRTASQRAKKHSMPD